jgi:ubiquinone/menaquinone biosynthesis C-methylase UbiE
LSAHPRSQSFERVADVYEEARPEYPAEAVAWAAERLGFGPGSTVLDLGAGTGKLTRALVETGARVIAVEPLPAMRAKLVELLPDVEALEGAAEEIPLEDASVDAVAVGQAFHWFRLDEALPELHRVLRPGGGLALLWNGRRPGSFADLMREILRKVEAATPPARDRDWQKAMARSPLFGTLQRRTFEWDEPRDDELLVKRVLSISYVAALPQPAQEAIADQVRAAARRLPERLPYLTNVFIAFRQTGAR